MVKLRLLRFGIVSLFLSAAFLLDVSLYSDSLIAQGTNEQSEIDYYSCMKEENKIRCDNSSDFVESYSSKAKWTKIYQVTAEAKFVQGKFDKALEIDEIYSESTVLSDTPIQNTLFSISAWFSISDVMENIEN